MLAFKEGDLTKLTRIIWSFFLLFLCLFDTGVSQNDASSDEKIHVRKTKKADHTSTLENFLKLGSMWDRAKRSHLGEAHTDYADMHRSRLTGYRLLHYKRREKRSDALVDDKLSLYAAIGGATLLFLMVILAFICWCSKRSAYRKSEDGKTLVPDDTPAVFSVVKGYENLAYRTEDVVDQAEPQEPPDEQCTCHAE